MSFHDGSFLKVSRSQLAKTPDLGPSRFDAFGSDCGLEKKLVAAWRILQAYDASTVDLLPMHPAEFGKLAVRPNLVEIADPPLPDRDEPCVQVAWGRKERERISASSHRFITFVTNGTRSGL